MTSAPSHLRAALCAAAWLVAATPSQGAPFLDLARLLPSDANAIVAVNAESLFESPLGQQEQWRQQYADAFEAAPLIVPPRAERGVLAAEIDLTTLKSKWEAASLLMSIDPTVQQIAQQRGGRVDRLVGMDAAWLGGSTCLLKFGPKQFGVMSPATRQEAARWAADAHRGATGSLSPYLEHAIGYADEAGTQLVLALDLADVLSEAQILAALKQATDLNGVAPEAAAAVIATLQGVTFGVRVNSERHAALRLDFAEDAAPLAPIAKPLAIKAVSRAGAMLPEFNDWTAEVQGSTIELKGELSADGMRRIFSLLTLDVGAINGDAAPPATPEDDAAAKQNLAAQASLRYFRGIGRYVEDLQRLQRAHSLDQAIVWIENYARKVERLPTRNVDPDLVEYGKYVAETFRQIVDEASGALNQADAAADPVVRNYRIGYLPTARTVNYGGYFTRMYAPYANMDIDVQATQQNVQQSEDALYQTVQAAQQSLARLTADHETVRRNLSTKFGIQF
ncbi:MAG TPA: hypothetical protein PJ982_09040 [Lacipirellulaceae bacterium]|nr:hypothetical protein [Lacipirellulaceae bacterium]